MMCDACTNDQHELCGMQTWCACECDGPDTLFYPEYDPYDVESRVFYGEKDMSLLEEQ